MTLGERIKQLRKAKGMTQQTLANEWKISKRSIEMYESGGRKPDVDALCDIADYFCVTTDYLLGRVDIPNIYAHEIEDATVLGTEEELSQQMHDQLKTIDEIDLPEIEFTGSFETLEQIVRRIVADEMRKASK